MELNRNHDDDDVVSVHCCRHRHHCSDPFYRHPNHPGCLWIVFDHCSTCFVRANWFSSIIPMAVRSPVEHVSAMLTRNSVERKDIFAFRQFEWFLFCSVVRVVPVKWYRREPFVLDTSTDTFSVWPLRASHGAGNSIDGLDDLRVVVNVNVFDDWHAMPLWNIAPKCWILSQPAICRSTNRPNMAAAPDLVSYEVSVNDSRTLLNYVKNLFE